MDALVFPVAQPGVNGHVGNGVHIACDVFTQRQLLVHHAIQALGFIGIAVYGIRNFFGRILAEMVVLAQHGTNPAHLEHQPLQDFKLGSVRFGQKLSRLGRQIQQNRSGLEDADGFAIRPDRVDQSRDFVVRADGQKLRRELFALSDVDRMGQPVTTQPVAAFFQHDVNFVAIGCGPAVNVDQVISHVQLPRVTGMSTS